jgi:hypothetical protein
MYFRRYYGYEEHNFVTGFKNDHATSIGKRREFRYANGLGILELKGKRYIYPTFPYRIKREITIKI